MPPCIPNVRQRPKVAGFLSSLKSIDPWKAASNISICLLYIVVALPLVPMVPVMFHSGKRILNPEIKSDFLVGSILKLAKS